MRPTRCRPSRLCELSWYEVSEPAKHLSLSPNLAVVAYLDNAKLDLVVMPPPPRVSWQLVAAHYLVTKEAGHCAPRAHPLPDYLLLHTKLGRNKYMAITSLNTMVVSPEVGPGNPSFQAVDSLSNCGYAILGLAVLSGCRRSASLNTASLGSSRCSVTTCLLLLPSPNSRKSQLSRNSLPVRWLESWRCLPPPLLLQGDAPASCKSHLLLGMLKPTSQPPL